MLKLSAMKEIEVDDGSFCPLPNVPSFTEQILVLIFINAVRSTSFPKGGYHSRNGHLLKLGCDLLY
jgi:hypothetical protein